MKQPVTEAEKKSMIHACDVMADAVMISRYSEKMQAGNLLVDKNVGVPPETPLVVMTADFVESVLVALRTMYLKLYVQ